MNSFEQDRAALFDRRQRAREAYHDRLAANDQTVTRMPAIEEAIETATRVKLDGDILHAFAQASGLPMHSYGQATATGLAAAFLAAGFETEE